MKDDVLLSITADKQMIDQQEEFEIILDHYRTHNQSNK